MGKALIVKNQCFFAKMLKKCDANFSFRKIHGSPFSLAAKKVAKTCPQCYA